MQVSQPFMDELAKPPPQVIVVELLIDASLVEAFDLVSGFLPGRELARKTSPDGTQLAITMAMPDAPPNAVSMSPWFTKHDDGTITLTGIDYYDADHNRLT